MLSLARWTSRKSIHKHPLMPNFPLVNAIEWLHHEDLFAKKYLGSFQIIQNFDC